jgi:hypothetical protein
MMVPAPFPGLPAGLQLTAVRVAVQSNAARAGEGDFGAENAGTRETPTGWSEQAPRAATPKTPQTTISRTNPAAERGALNIKSSQRMKRLDRCCRIAAAGESGAAG